jgi:hypothetical protein
MSVKTWTTQAGEVIKIKDMTDSHLLNTISYLEKRVENMKMESGGKMIEIGELSFTAGTEASDIAAMTDMEFLEKYTPYPALVKEKNKRKPK